MKDKEESVLKSEQAERHLRLSARLLWWLPLSPLVGFITASWLLAESWPLWQVVPLAVVLATPFGFGVYHGLKAIRLGKHSAFIPVMVHAVLGLVALVMPVAEALTV